ncbi:HP0495 family protein [Vreelandella zhanjiangensis]|uniref:HP0495 family protein n=1 Tax=Vreelandella zhanjiangensis TaxID=1121960 RepID=UPI00402AB8E7
MKKGANDGFRDLRQPTVTEPPKITFPCDYPLKIVGDAADDFTACVCQIVVRHAPDFDESTLEVVDSRNGRFQSVRITINATSEQQISQLFDELKATGRVHMVV